MMIQVADASSQTDDLENFTDVLRKLDIRVSQQPKPPSAKHNLLLGFGFSSKPATTMCDGMVNLQLRPLEQKLIHECWWYAGPVTYSKSGSVRLAECDDYTVAIIEKPPADKSSFKAQTCEAYCELLSAIRSTQHSKLTKVWNYFDDINNGEGDSEKYKQFSAGRAQAFWSMGISDENSPTGTAIGTQGDGGLVLIALASKRCFQAVENPRQVSAFHYPRTYGPSSPKFSRGGIVSSTNHKLYLISGTASVVGHSSSFPHDTYLQIIGTMKNLRSLCEAITVSHSEKEQFLLNGASVIRVYVKNPDDYPVIARELANAVDLTGQNVIYLHGTICRKELMVEIDGLKSI